MRLRWSGAALDDLDRIAEFNEQRSFAWARRVHARIIARAESLVQTPKQGRPVPDTGSRFLSIPDIQYVIDYRIERDEVHVLQIWSTRQDRGNANE